MKFNPEHAIEHKSKFAALRWCIERAKLNIDDGEEYKGYLFKGSVPYHQIVKMSELKKLGYRHPGDSEILSINWVVGNKYHGVSVTFKKSGIELSHQVFQLTESEVAQYQAN